jgi:hypothetical protein
MISTSRTLRVQWNTIGKFQGLRKYFIPRLLVFYPDRRLLWFRTTVFHMYVNRKIKPVETISQLGWRRDK